MELRRAKRRRDITLQTQQRQLSQVGHDPAGVTILRCPTRNSGRRRSTGRKFAPSSTICKPLRIRASSSALNYELRETATSSSAKSSTILGSSMFVAWSGSRSSSLDDESSITTSSDRIRIDAHTFEHKGQRYRVAVTDLTLLPQYRGPDVEPTGVRLSLEATAESDGQTKRLQLGLGDSVTDDAYLRAEIDRGFGDVIDGKLEPRRTEYL